MSEKQLKAVVARVLMARFSNENLLSLELLLEEDVKTGKRPVKLDLILDRLCRAISEREFDKWKSEDLIFYDTLELCSYRRASFLYEYLIKLFMGAINENKTQVN